MTKNKKILTAALSIALVVIVALGGTLAYLYTKTDTETNVFTFGDNVKATLTEPSWDPDDGLDLVPGMEIAKDPLITNTSKNGVDEYAGIRIVFTRGDGTVLTAAETTKLLGLITIDWSANWTLIDGTATSAKQTYFFNDILTPSMESDSLFYSVTINTAVTPEELLWLAGDYGHDEDTCYEFGTCDCTITYKHHEKCAIRGESGNENVGLHGVLNGKTCDCKKVATVHESGCASLKGTLKAGCGHTLQSGIGNFNIEVQGAVVQADAFTAIADAKTAIKSLLPVS